MYAVTKKWSHWFPRRIQRIAANSNSDLTLALKGLESTLTLFFRKTALVIKSDISLQEVNYCT
jgi:hypothetical protein